MSAGGTRNQELAALALATQWPLPVDKLIPLQGDATAPQLRETQPELAFGYTGVDGPCQVVG